MAEKKAATATADLAAELAARLSQPLPAGTGSSVSFGTTDPQGFDTLPSSHPDPATIVADYSIQGQLDSLMHQDEEIIRTEAKRHGLSEAAMRAIRKMQPDAYQELVGEWINVEEFVQRELDQGTVELAGGEQAKYYIEDMSREDVQAWTYLWDAPGSDGVVRGRSKILRAEAHKKLRGPHPSHTLQPQGKLMPPPDNPCVFQGSDSMPCPFRGRTVDVMGRPTRDMMEHYESKHPSQLRAQREQEVSAERQSAIASNQTLVQVMAELLTEIRAGRNPAVTATAPVQEAS